MIDIRSKYHIALNDIGFILQGAPEQPAYILEQAAIFNNRLAQGDRSYDDFSKYWYWAQTDFFQGLKHDTMWADDGKFFFSTNIDPWSEPGAIKLARASSLINDFTEEIIVASQLNNNNNAYKYYGTLPNSGTSIPVVYEYNGSSYVDITTDMGGGEAMTTNESAIASLTGNRGYVIIGTVSSQNEVNCVIYRQGTAIEDISDHIGNAMSFGTARACRAGDAINGTIYLIIDTGDESILSIVTSSSDTPTTDIDWTEVYNGYYHGIPLAAKGFGGNLIYLTSINNTLRLYKYDIANDVNTLLRVFRNVTISEPYGLQNLLQEVQGVLLVTIPNKEVWALSTSDSIARLFRTDEFKTTNFSTEGTPDLTRGCVIQDNKAWWGNLMWDGEHFYNTFKESTDATNSKVYPLYVDTANLIHFTDSVDRSIVHAVNPEGSSYKGSDNKNYIVLNQFEAISGIDKVLYSVTLIFKKFASGQSIEVEYTTGELNSSTTWTSLGVASHTLDGADVTEKTLYFPVNTTCKKVWYRIKLEAGGSNTPVLYDIVTAYLPRPFVDKQWRLNVNCGDNTELLNGSIENRNGREIKGQLEQAWLTNQIVDFQDVDYASTILNGGINSSATTITVDDTSEFPEYGRLRIDNEIIYYSGKTQKTFKNCVRGRKGTLAVAHSDDAAVHNGYKVLIESFNARVPILNKEKNVEYVAGLSLREVI